MPALTIKGMPDPLYRRLKKRAAEHRRSLNSEILFCLERAVDVPFVTSDRQLLGSFPETVVALSSFTAGEAR